MLRTQFVEEGAFQKIHNSESSHDSVHEVRQLDCLRDWWRASLLRMRKETQNFLTWWRIFFDGIRSFQEIQEILKDQGHYSPSRIVIVIPPMNMWKHLAKLSKEFELPEANLMDYRLLCKKPVSVHGLNDAPLAWHSWISPRTRWPTIQDGRELLSLEKQLPFNHCGCQYERLNDGLRISQADFAKKLEKVDNREDSSKLVQAEISNLRAVLGALLWITATRLDVIADVSILQSRVTVDANSVVDNVKQFQDVGLHYRILKAPRLRLVSLQGKDDTMHKKAKRVSFATSHAETRLSEMMHPDAPSSLAQLTKIREESSKLLPVDYNGDCRDVFELVTQLRPLSQDGMQRLYVLSLKEARLIIPTQCMTSDALTRSIMIHASLLLLLTGQAPRDITSDADRQHAEGDGSRHGYVTASDRSYARLQRGQGEHWTWRDDLIRASGHCDDPRALFPEGLHQCRGLTTKTRLTRVRKVKKEIDGSPMDVDSSNMSRMDEDQAEATIRTFKKKIRKLEEDKEEIAATIRIKMDCIKNLEDTVTEKQQMLISNADFMARQEQAINQQSEIEHWQTENCLGQQRQDDPRHGSDAIKPG
eukprot:s279_g9.t1